MIADPADFTSKQWAFLAVLEAFGQPVPVDLAAALAPLAPGLLLDLLERGLSLGLLEKNGPQLFGLAADLPEEIRKKLAALNDPDRLAWLNGRLKDLKLISLVPPQALARLFSRSGRLIEAACMEADLARTAVVNGRLEEAYRSLLTGLKMLVPVLGHPENDGPFVAAALDFSSLTFILGLDFDRAVDYLQQARVATLRLGDQRSRAMTDLHLGRFYYLGDRRLDAISAFETGRKTVEELGDEDILIQAAEFIGLYYFLRGLHLEAVEHLERATQASEASRIIGLVNPSAPLYLGFCAAYLGQFHRAVGSLDCFWRRAKREANPVLASTYRAALGAVLLQIDKKKEGRFHLEGALKDAEAGRNALAKYSALGGLAYFYYTENQIGKAREFLSRLIAEGTGSGIRRQYGSPYVLELLFEFHRLGLEPIPSFSFHDQIERLLREPSVHLRGVALRLMAMDELIAGGDLQKIRADLEESEQCLIKSGDPIQLAKTRVEMAQLCVTGGNRRDARILVQKARKGLSGHSENLFPDALRALLEDLELDAEVAVTPAETLLTNLEDIIASPFAPILADSLHALFLQLNRLLGAERGGLFWRNDPQDPDPVLRAGRNLTDVETAKPEFEPSLNLIRRILRTGRPSIQRTALAGSPAGRETRAVLLLPLTLDGRVRGVLYHDNSYFPDCFEGLPKTVLEDVATRLSGWIQRADQFARLLEETKRLTLERSVLRDLSNGGEIIIGPSPAMVRILDMADRAAASDSNVLIQGETGVGKELLARRLHERSPRAKKPFVTVDPTTIPENLMESELFGHEKGAFTGADRRKPGWVELAHTGTLFIDEIGEIPKASQAKLLRVLQEKTFVRIGGTRSLTSDFRLIAATNRILEAEVAAGRFREDLFFRLNIVNLKIPPLRERPGDILPLARHFLARFAKKYNRPGLEFLPDNEEKLKSYPWPGNVRELQNLIERAVILSTGARLQLSLPAPFKHSTEHPFQDHPTLDELQRRYIYYALEMTGGRIGGSGGAAQILGLKRTTLHTRMKKLGLKRK
jgi:transcriptional regulator with GAF, ATPase, and Fis domain